ncbi:MAG: hypothetical protein IT530_16040 [Burkholderiales bacterium]|nr:hypothetical protein [Burkholderiales bacterium]
MKVDVAIQYARALEQAAKKALDEGRDEITNADLDAFAALDDEARGELEAAIKRASGR